MSLAVVGGLFFVGYTMFPDMFAGSTGNPSVTIDIPTGTPSDGPIITDPEDPNTHGSAEIPGNPEIPEIPDFPEIPIIDPICNGNYHGHALFTLSAEDNLCTIGNSKDFLKTETGRIRECEGDEGTLPIQCSAALQEIAGPVIPDDIIPIKTEQEMMRELNSLENAGKLYLDVGEMDGDKCIVKYAGYILYQAGFLKSDLENDRPLSIEEYVTRVGRMNTILSRLDSYLNGQPLPECSQASILEDETDLEKQEIQDYIYSQYGISPF